MSEILGNLKPQAVFHYFEQMTKIPRESGNEAAISEYLVNFIDYKSKREASIEIAALPIFYIAEPIKSTIAVNEIPRYVALVSI